MKPPFLRTINPLNIYSILNPETNFTVEFKMMWSSTLWKYNDLWNSSVLFPFALVTNVQHDPVYISSDTASGKEGTAAVHVSDCQWPGEK